MRDISNCLNAILVLLTLPLYLLSPLAAFAGRALESRAPGRLPPGLAFIATDIFLVIAVGLFLWRLIVYVLAIGRLQSKRRLAWTLNSPLNSSNTSLPARPACSRDSSALTRSFCRLGCIIASGAAGREDDHIR